ncbi:hypothetical protein AFLA_001510 [Aspergillus flavus NRRL3357]|nr:hypothetical protein AFLA_001510 [Aspergillus flavus NRRL3357]
MDTNQQSEEARTLILCIVFLMTTWSISSISQLPHGRFEQRVKLKWRVPFRVPSQTPDLMIHVTTTLHDPRIDNAQPPVPSFWWEGRYIDYREWRSRGFAPSIISGGTLDSSIVPQRRLICLPRQSGTSVGAVAQTNITSLGRATVALARDTGFVLCIDLGVAESPCSREETSSNMVGGPADAAI